MRVTSKAVLLLVNIIATARGADYPRHDEICNTDADCYDQVEVCIMAQGASDQAQEEPTGTCKHKSVLPMTTSEIVGTSMVPFLFFAAQSGGLAGGGSALPVTMFFFGFDTKQAIALSNASICAGSIVRYLYLFRRSHPLKEGKGVLVDYSIASIMLPMIVVGATLGVMVNKTLPSVVIAAILFVLLAMMTLTTLRKLLKIIKEERVKYGPLCNCCLFGSYGIGKLNRIGSDLSPSDRVASELCLTRQVSSSSSSDTPEKTGAN